MIKVAVAMSGGVDSSVATALMVEKYGKENVFGVTAKLFCYAKESKNKKACCSLEAIDDAKAVCDKLGISHYVINEEKEFEKAVIKNFVGAYRHGQTPIPCVPCNSVIKFGTMLKKVKDLGADKLITGHYARIAQVKSDCHSRENGNLDSGSKPRMTYDLLRGVDSVKDQTYFLYGLNQEQLSHVEFPVGEMKKSEVRKIAKNIGLKVAEKQESQGICFITEGRVTDYLKDKIENKPGDIVDTEGNIIDKHDGYIFYTIGQRKRIGGGYKEPMFVVKIDPLKNEVVIGGKESLYKKELIYVSSTWLAGVGPKLPLRCTAKIRYNTEDAECTIEKIESKYGEYYGAIFNEPQRAITPGQSIVLYDGDRVLGGGIIV